MKTTTTLTLRSTDTLRNFNTIFRYNHCSLWDYHSCEFTTMHECIDFSYNIITFISNFSDTSREKAKVNFINLIFT